jgi:hypothetical protein
MSFRPSRTATKNPLWAIETRIKVNLHFFDLLPTARETAERYSEIREGMKSAGSLPAIQGPRVQTW